MNERPNDIEHEFGEHPTNIAVMPPTFDTTFSNEQNEEISNYIERAIQRLPVNIQPPNIQLIFQYGILIGRCADDYAKVLLVLILSMWDRNRLSLISSELVTRRVYTGLFPELTEPDCTILCRLRYPLIQDGALVVSPNTSGWYIRNMEPSEGGLKIVFDVDLQSSLALEERELIVVYKGRNIQLS